MKKLLFTILLTGLLAPLATAQETASKPSAKTTLAAQQKAQFKARRKQIKQLVKKYHKAAAQDKPAIKEQLAQVVSQNVDAGMNYMKNRIAAERANLDNWEAKIKQDEANLPQVKAQRVEDLLSGEAKKKQKAARKAWKQQIKSLKK